MDVPQLRAQSGCEKSHPERDEELLTDLSNPKNCLFPALLLAIPCQEERKMTWSEEKGF